MVWLNQTGSIQPIGSKIGTANIAGATWDVWSGNIGWNVISYVRQHADVVAELLVNDFWNDVVSRGLGSTSWYLTSIQAGFEPWVGGAGLAVNSFSVTTDGTQPTQTPTPTSHPDGHRRTTGPAAARRPRRSPGHGRRVPDRGHGEEHRLATLSRWAVKWAFPGGQTINNLWNGVASQSGSNVTVANAPHNGLLSGGASTSFGFVGNGSAPGSLALPAPPPDRLTGAGPRDTRLADRRRVVGAARPRVPCPGACSAPRRRARPRRRRQHLAGPAG